VSWTSTNRRPPIKNWFLLFLSFFASCRWLRQLVSFLVLNRDVRESKDCVTLRWFFTQSVTSGDVLGGRETLLLGAESGGEEAEEKKESVFNRGTPISWSSAHALEVVVQTHVSLQPIAQPYWMILHILHVRFSGTHLVSELPFAFLY